jgi:Uma2 family endonuclease
MRPVEVRDMGDAALRYGATLEGFLAWEERQPERYEFVGGIVRLMSGGTEGHDRISVNLTRLLSTALRGTPCSVHASNLKIVARDANASMYPELFVRCGPRDDRRTRSEDPVVVFEVLSESTAQFDLTRKRLAYESIPTLRRIVFVSQIEPRLDMRVRDRAGSWGDEVVDRLDSFLELPELGLRLPLAEIYEDTSAAEA